jgi:hypothetical protein
MQMKMFYTRMNIAAPGVLKYERFYQIQIPYPLQSQKAFYNLPPLRAICLTERSNMSSAYNQKIGEDLRSISRYNKDIVCFNEYSSSIWPSPSQEGIRDSRIARFLAEDTGHL